MEAAVTQPNVDAVQGFLNQLLGDPDYLTRLRNDPTAALAEVGVTSDRGVEIVSTLLKAEDESIRQSLRELAQAYAQAGIKGIA
jgi:hypothetical protein